MYYLAGVLVNGTALPPIKETITSIREFSHAMAVLSNPTPRLCHGDLIPEDILVDAEQGGVCLIDPNPQICDPIADLAKLLMSCSVHYDLALRDMVTCSVSRGPMIEVVHSVPEGVSGYTKLQTELAAQLADEAPNLIGRAFASDDRMQPACVRLIAGLQAMAISSFHSLHHDKEARAFYFMVEGQRLVERALAELG